MKSILISGGTGLIGSKLIESLNKSKYKIYVLTRKRSFTKNGVHYISWNPKNLELNISKIKNLYSVINLVGQPIDGWLWTKAYKKKLLNSRVDSTKLLFQKVKDLKLKPESFISASAIGYYDFDTLKPQDENDVPGKSFLSEVVQEWEKEISKFKSLKVRTTTLRIGLVFSRNGGILKKLYPLFKFFLGVPLGSGNQIMSWIHEDDMINIIIKVLENKNLKGTFNAVAPERTTNLVFTKSLLKVLNRFSYPEFIKVPSIFLRITLGEQSDLILNGLNVSSKKLIKENYKFKFPELMFALKSIYDEKKSK